ncbi:MAG: cache domain-containing protein, partial [Bacteroidales bacterium]|nr:cache domain-containing protein [Bacteroidales bacterium]
MRLVIIFLAIAIIPIVLFSWITSGAIRNTLTEIELENMNTRKEVLQQQIIDRLNTQVEDLKMIAISENTNQAVIQFKDYFTELDDDYSVFDYKDKSYNRLHRNISPFFQRLTDNWNMEDVLLIDAANGQVLFSLNNLSQIGVRMESQRNENPSLYKLWQFAIYSDLPTLIDFNLNDNDKAVSYIGVPIVNDKGFTEVIIAMEMGQRALDHIMDYDRDRESSDGIDFFLIGEDLKLRSKPLQGEGNTVLGTTIQTEASKMVSGNMTGSIQTTNHKGAKVLSSYIPLDNNKSDHFYCDFNWYLLLEMNQSTINMAINGIMKVILFSMIGISVIIILIGVFLAK